MSASSPTIPLSEYSPLLLDEHLNAVQHDELARRVAMLELALTAVVPAAAAARSGGPAQLRVGQRHPLSVRAEAAFNAELSGACAAHLVIGCDADECR